ncbi:uncharacterized protein LOC130590477 [Beta vulgaris subsp. vulgaris]|uniref:uncharacterized protein LOC130590477 n=1 Tax=Beta vulgaris subsp. vulgaris TaxID=3555 RepID=UPI002546AC38|nr:uncharacterized protein LOC130590477 [Beta vulgaris subsp. vulgaris]
MDNIVSWNVRGLNSRRKQGDVRQFLVSHNIKLFSFLETKIKAPALGDFYLNVCPGWCITTNNQWHGNGRIVLGWQPSAFHVNIIKCTSQLIHTIVEVVNGGRTFKCTCIYGFNEKKGREELWSDLRQLATNDEPWIIMGDFNALMSIEDRLGQPVRTREIEDMKACMIDCKLMEVKVSGQFFTWNNKQEGRDRVFCKLDRVMGNDGWITDWQHTEVANLPEGEFDHCPLVIRSFVNESKKKPFRFFNMWCQAEQFQEIVRQGWQCNISGTKMYMVVGKLKLLKKELKRLNASQFGDVLVQHVEKYTKMMEAQTALHGNPSDMSLRALEKEAREAYVVAHRNYSLLLSQKAKLKWLTEGDDNTRYFHQSVKLRRIHNKINTIKKENGEWAVNSNEVANAFLEFYQGLLGSEGRVRKVENVIIAKGNILDDAQQQALSLVFNADEIKQALFSIPDNRARWILKLLF